MTTRVTITSESWKKVQLDGKDAVKVQCGGCGRWMYLDHTVQADGNVNPSLDCPECPWHVFAILAGWLP